MRSQTSNMQILIHIIGILILGWVSAYIALQLKLLVFLWPFAFMVLLIFRLHRIINKEKKQVYYYLMALRDNIFSEKKIEWHVNKDLSRASEELKLKVKELVEQKNINHLFLENVTKHIDIAIICFDDTHEVHFMNNMARSILNRNSLINIEQIKNSHPEFYKVFTKEVHNRYRLIEYNINEIDYLFLVKCMRFDIKERKYYMISLEDIKEPLYDREIQAWRNLVRYMSHEIMNSLIPISNLSEYAKNVILSKKYGEEEKVINSLETVSHRCKGLVKSVQAARNMAHLPEPQFKKVQVADLLGRVYNLMSPELFKSNINFQLDPDIPDIYLDADFEMIEQVLINLIGNAKDSLNNVDKPQIMLKCDTHTYKKVVIGVCDNGHGIEPEILDKIFVPFFTTKANGSGIGLSLSRQIMHLHKGNLKVHTKPGNTILMMEFPIAENAANDEN